MLAKTRNFLIAECYHLLEFNDRHGIMMIVIYIVYKIDKFLPKQRLAAHFSFIVNS